MQNIIQSVILISVALLFNTGVCHAGDEVDPKTGLDAASTEALNKTQQLLTTTTDRNKAITGDAKATWVNKQVESVGGSPQNTEDIYGLASDIFAEITKQAKGDPEKMNELLMKAQKDPTAFGNSFTAAQKEKLNAISRRVPAASQTPPSSSAPSPLLK